MQIIKNGVAWLLALLEFVNHLELMAENKKKKLKIMIGCFYRVFLRRWLRLNVAKSKC